MSLGQANTRLLGYLRSVERHKMMARAIIQSTLWPHMKKGRHVRETEMMPVSFDYDKKPKKRKVSPERFKEMKAKWNIK